MKRLTAILLSILMLVSAQAAFALDLGDRAVVANCNEYITLREKESTSAAEIKKLMLNETVNVIADAANGFAEVESGGKRGYVLDKYLQLQDHYSGEAVEVSDGERSVINLFLTDFSRQGMNNYDEADMAEEWAMHRDAFLLHFAIQHIRLDHQDQLEWGDYFGMGNVRVKKELLPEVACSYFNLEIGELDAADYSQTEDYYYWQETGGNVPRGFACMRSVESLGGGRYAVRFEIYGAGEGWSSDVCALRPEEAARNYEKFSDGMAVIATDEPLSNRGAQRLERWITK